MTPKSPLKTRSYTTSPSPDWTRVDSTDTTLNSWSFPGSKQDRE